MVVTVVLPLKEVAKEAVNKNEEGSGEATYDEIQVVKNAVIQTNRRSQLSKKGKLCIVLTLLVLILGIGFNLGFYFLREKFVFQRTGEEGQRGDTGSCSSFPNEMAQNPFFFLICQSKQETPTASQDKFTDKFVRDKENVGMVSVKRLE